MKVYVLVKEDDGEAEVFLNEGVNRPRVHAYVDPKKAKVQAERFGAIVMAVDLSDGEML